CAYGTFSSLLSPSGFGDGATLTVAESGAGRTATFMDVDGHTTSWRFAPTTAASAALAPSPQTTDSYSTAICVYGIGVSNESFFPTQLDAGMGALEYASGAMFVSLVGELSSHTDCGDLAVPGNVWISCNGGPAPDLAVAPSSAPFPSGTFTCKS